MSHSDGLTPSPTAAPPRLGKTLFDARAIDARIKDLAAQIDADYAGSVPVLITVLKGAVVFACDLARHMQTVHEMDFLAISAYGDEMPGQHARILKDLQLPIAGRDVIIVEDIIDTGLTLRFLVRWLETHEPASIKVCTLLDRPHRRLSDVDITYRGFTVPDRFLVGYGFDYQQSFRQVPDLCELAVGDADAVATEQVHPSW